MASMWKSISKWKSIMLVRMIILNYSQSVVVPVTGGVKSMGEDYRLPEWGSFIWRFRPFTEKAWQYALNIQ